jgi:hypothetical protein
MNSKSASRGLGLSQKSNPKRGVGPVQTTVQDALTCIVPSSRYTPYGESAGDSPLLAVMKLVRVGLLSWRTLPLGNILSIDRGTSPSHCWSVAPAKDCILFVCTSPAKTTFPFAQSDSKLSDSDKRVVVKDKVGQRDRWMQRKERTSRVLGSNVVENRVYPNQRSVPRPLKPVKPHTVEPAGEAVRRPGRRVCPNTGCATSRAWGRGRDRAS